MLQFLISEPTDSFSSTWFHSLEIDISVCHGQRTNPRALAPELCPEKIFDPRIPDLASSLMIAVQHLNFVLIYKPYFMANLIEISWLRSLGRCIGVEQTSREKEFTFTEYPPWRWCEHSYFIDKEAEVQRRWDICPMTSKQVVGLGVNPDLPNPYFHPMFQTYTGVDGCNGKREEENIADEENGNIPGEGLEVGEKKAVCRLLIGVADSWWG